jgi:hypothetical protein
MAKSDYGPFDLVVDFSGYTSPGHFPTSFWAEWNRDEKQVHFGGDWHDVPLMKAKRRPTQAQVYKHANRWMKKFLAKEREIFRHLANE